VLELVAGSFSVSSEFFNRQLSYTDFSYPASADSLL